MWKEWNKFEKKIVEVEERENEYYSLKKVEEMQGIKAPNWVTGYKTYKGNKITS